MTLVELVTSLGIFSVLVLAMGSTILIATRALEISAAGAAPTQGSVASRIAADFQTALAFTERDKAIATFTVPDRDGDGLPETLRYFWSGTPGDPITLSYNGGTPMTIAEDVHRFNLSYLLRTTAPALDPAEQEQESEEMVLIFHDDAPRGQFRSRNLRSGQLSAQYFDPTLPTNVVSWKVTRVSVRLLGAFGSGADVLVQVRPANAAQKPAAQILEEASVPVSSLPSVWTWVDFNFASLPDLDPDAGYCVVVTSTLPEYSGGLQHERGGDPMTPDTHWMTSDDGGASWTDPVNNKDMRFYVHGTVTTLGDPEWP